MRNNSIKLLAWRFLQGQKKHFLSRSHTLTMLGISLGVMALLCISSVMNGFRRDMQKRIVGTLSEIRITLSNQQKTEGYERILEVCEARGFHAAPVIRNELILRNGSIIEPTMSFGIDYLKHRDVSEILKPNRQYTKSDLRQGLITSEPDWEEFNTTGIILGSGLAYKLNAQPGDVIQLISPIFTLPTAFGLLPRIRNLKVVAVFAAGMPEYDAMYSFIPLEISRSFREDNAIADYIEVSTSSYLKSKESASILRKDLPGYEIDDWSSFDPSLYNAIRFEKFMMFVIMLFMYIIASFNLTGNMLKTIAQKKKELGLLKAIGYRDPDLNRLFVFQSLILTSIGILIGAILALSLLMLQARFGLIKMELSATAFITLPVYMQWHDFVIVILAAYMISIASILFPLRQLRGIDPIALLRQNVMA